MPTQTQFTGTADADTFTFAHHNAKNTIRGFDADHDTLKFHGFSPHEIRIVQEYQADGTPVAHIHAGGFAGFGTNHTEVSLIGVKLADLSGHIASNGDILFA